MQNEIDNAVRILKAGGVILYPTDTIWGIGCDATNDQAVEKIYQIKERDPGKSMLILVKDTRMVSDYLDELPDIAAQLFELSDSPLTIILDGAAGLASNLPAADGSIGMRIPDESFCQALLQRFGKPIVSTSANLSGQSSPGSFADISEELISRMDYVVKIRQAEQTGGKASSIIRLFKNGEFKLIR